MVALAHVEAAGVGEEADVGEVAGALGPHVASAVRRLLERNAVLLPRGDVDEGAAVGPEHPLVGREDQEIWIEPCHVGGDDADGVGRIDEKPAAGFAQGVPDGHQVDQSAIGPMDRRDRGQRHRRRAGAADGVQDGAGPVAICRLRDGLDPEALRRRACQPFENGRAVVVFQDEDARARLVGEKLSGDGDPIPDGGNERHIVRRGADEGGRRVARTLVLDVGEIGRNGPGLALAADGTPRCVLRRQRQGAPAGGIEIADVAGDIEQVALRGEHGWFSCDPLRLPRTVC